MDSKSDPDPASLEVGITYIVPSNEWVALPDAQRQKALEAISKKFRERLAHIMLVSDRAGLDETRSENLHRRFKLILIVLTNLVAAVNIVGTYLASQEHRPSAILSGSAAAIISIVASGFANFDAFRAFSIVSRTAANYRVTLTNLREKSEFNWDAFVEPFGTSYLAYANAVRVFGNLNQEFAAARRASQLRPPKESPSQQDQS